MTERVPRIFDRRRASAKWGRARARQSNSSSATYLFDTVIDDILDRLDFMRLAPGSAMLIGDPRSRLAEALRANGCQTQAARLGEFDEEQPHPHPGVDLIVHLLGLGIVNDLPGALLHMRNALVDGGLFIAAFPGAGSFPALRKIALAADGDRPAARIHPQIDNRAATGLLERAGFKRQVVDSFPIQVRFSSLALMLSDLRDHGLTGSLSSPSPPITKAGYQRALEAFDQQRDDDGKVTETIEILVLTGWR